MRTNKLLLLASVLVAVLSCGKIPDSSSKYVSKVSFDIDRVIPVEDLESSTRTSLDADDNFIWAPSDTVGIYPDTGSQVFFVTSQNQSAGSAVFDGGGWSFKEGCTYSCYYPFIGDIYLKRDHIPVSFTNQKQVGTAGIDHIGAHHYMYTNPTQSVNGGLSFALHHLVCFIRPRLTLPAGTYTKLAIVTSENVFPIKGYYDLSSGNCSIVPAEYTNQLQIDLEGVTLTEETTFRVYLVSAPVNLAGTEITVCVLDSQKKERQCKKTPSSNYAAGTLAGLTCSSWTEVPQSMGLILEDWGDGGTIGGTAE